MKKLLLVHVAKKVQTHRIHAAKIHTIREPSPVFSITANVRQNNEATPLMITPKPKIL